MKEAGAAAERAGDSNEVRELKGELSIVCLPPQCPPSISWTFQGRAARSDD